MSRTPPKKAHNPLSPGARLVARNLHNPRAFVRKLIIGEVIGDMVRERIRPEPGAAERPATTGRPATARAAETASGSSREDGGK